MLMCNMKFQIIFKTINKKLLISYNMIYKIKLQTHKAKCKNI